jgi:hypothetical protein
MPLIAALRADPLLAPFLKSACAERGMAATISPDIAHEDIVIISPDGYYNSALGRARHQPTPKSPDCLVVVKCRNGEFLVFVIELRDIGSPRGFTPAEIRGKFLTCLTDFMQGVLGEHFNREDIRLQRPRLLFVSDPYNQRQNPAPSSRYNQTTRMDALLTVPPLRFDRYLLAIEPHLHDPLIRPC